MRALRTSAVVVLAAIAIAACGHKLIAPGDSHTVKVYPDEETYEKIKELKNQSGPMAMFGGIGESIAAKEVDNNTPIRVISSDAEGSQIEITDGPNKGLQGFAPKENVD